MEPLRVAVWGLGRQAINKILPAISSTNGFELYGVCSRDADTVCATAGRWNCLGWTAPDTMLLDPQVDVVFVATPIGLHFGQGAQVLEANKHFWCEKPLTCRLEDTQALLKLSRHKGLSICEGHMYLYHPQFAKLVGYVRDGSLGPILSTACRFGIPKLERAGFRSNPALGGGALLDVGCYPLSAIQALFPNESFDIRYSSVVVPAGSAVDTEGEATIGISNGAVAHLEWRTNCAYRNEIDLWGEQGSVFSDRVFSKPAEHIPAFRLRNAQGVETTEFGEAGDHFQLMLWHFAATIDDHRAAEAERIAIERRAELLSRVWPKRVSG